MFKIMGGQDKEGFPMKQGVLTPGRVRLLMTPGDKCFRGYGRKNGERRRKTVRGCIVSNELAVLNLMIVKKGETSGLACSKGQAGSWNAPLHCWGMPCLNPCHGWLKASQAGAQLATPVCSCKSEPQGRGGSWQQSRLAGPAASCVHG